MGIEEALVKENKFCPICRKSKVLKKSFYKSHNLEKYPDGYLNTCRQCVALKVNKDDPKSYTWIFQECDVPYIPSEWNSIVDKYGTTASPAALVGRYIGKMALIQYKEYRWKDNEFLKERESKKLKEALQNQGYEMSEIDKTIDAIIHDVPEGDVAIPTADDLKRQNIENGLAAVASPTPVQQSFIAAQALEEEQQLNDMLTDEDRRYLRLKWGLSYSVEEWIRLEQLFQKMKDAYDVNGPGYEDTLRFICKLSVQSDKLLDLGDVDGAQKLLKTYDTLMHSGKFTAAQNKAQDTELVDSVGQLIEMCEKDGYIERYYTEEPKDRVDLTIKDMQRYTKTLIEGETNLSELVEQALLKNAAEDAKSKESSEEDIVDFDEEEDNVASVEEELKAQMEFNDFQEDLEEVDTNGIGRLN